MYELVAQIDSLDPRFYDEFKTIMENGTGDEIRDYLLNNCGCEHQQESEIYNDVIIQDSKYLVTYRDIMCETVSLYLL